MARVTRLELAASGVTGRRSNQLSYTRMVRGAVFSSAPCVAQAVFDPDFVFLCAFPKGAKINTGLVRRSSLFRRKWGQVKAKI